MSNELDTFNLYKAGEVGLYSPSQPLAPSPDWGNTELAPIDEYTQHSGGGQMVFGQTLPAGVSIAEVQATFAQLSNVFQSDFLTLKHKPSHVQAAVSWLMDALVNPPPQQRQRHRYNLFEHSSDPIFQAFANYAHDHGFSAKMVQDACWWVTEATKRINAQGSHEPPRTAPSSADPLDSLTDAQYAAVLKANQQAAAQTETVLRRKWGHSYDQNIVVAQQYLNNLPARERDHFDRYTTGFIHSLNTVPVLEGLFNMAIGSNSLPTGGAVATEIAEHERVMRYERKRWNSDERMQARYRTLLDIRDRK